MDSDRQHDDAPVLIDEAVLVAEYMEEGFSQETAASMAAAKVSETDAEVAKYLAKVIPEDAYKRLLNNIGHGLTGIDWALDPRKKQLVLDCVGTTWKAITEHPVVSAVASIVTRSVASFDPNDKLGPQGQGSEGYVSASAPLPYSVSFENKEAATASAQEVVVSDQLNSAALDLPSFGLGPMTFGDTLVVPPPGLSQYTTDVDLRPANNLIVRINAGLDMTTGLATWRFTSLDPATMLPTDDPLAGFLPPNVTSPEGQGSVLFTVMPKANLPTGIEIRNQATIVFDTNPPIVTPEWLDTIDNDRPVSYVAPLPATQTAGDFLVQGRPTGGARSRGVRTRHCGCGTWRPARAWRSCRATAALSRWRFSRAVWSSARMPARLG